MGNQKDLKSQSQASTPEKLKAKDCNRKLTKLRVEPVKLQEGIRHQRLKVCIVFEGRAGVGKGGAIKAIIDRVSPRRFQAMALSASTAVLG